MFFVRSRSNWNLEMSVINLNLQDRKEKFFTHKVPSQNVISLWIWAFCHVIYAMNHVTKRLGRSRGARDFKL